MKKTKHEKDADKIAKRVARVLGRPLTEFMELYKIDTTVMVAFKPLSDLLKRKRMEIHSDFKGFCKSHGFTQYKMKEMEERGIRNVDLNVLSKYVRIINAEDELKEWVSKYPNIAKKYKIDSIV